MADMLRDSDYTEPDIKAAVEMAGAVPGADPLWAEADRELLRSSCSYFAHHMLTGPKAAPYNGRFLIGPHHLEWDELASSHNRVCVMAARDHGKSFYWTLALPLWKAGYVAPGSTGMIFSATQPQAERLLGAIKTEILTNPKLAHLVPYTGERFWSAKRIRLRNGSTIVAAGFGVRVRGAHPDYVVCDDVLNDDDIYSETIRQRNIDYFLSAIAGMVHRSKQLALVGTPLHQADLYQAVRSTGQYTYREYPALKAGIPLWPARYSLEDLQAKRAELKSEARFAREFLCKPLSDEASLFPARLFEAPGVRQPYRLGLPAAYWDRMGYARYTGIDIALSAEVGADYFVIFTIAVDPLGNYWLANLRRHKGMAFSAQIELIKEEYQLMQPDMVYIEANQAQRVWTDELVRTTNIPVTRFFTTGIGGAQPLNGWRKGATSVAVNKHHIDRGVPGMRMQFEHGKWRIPRGDAHSIEMTDIWIGEMGMMGWVNGKVRSVGEHDDTVMASWICSSAASRGSGGSAFDNLLGDTETVEAGRTFKVARGANASPHPPAPEAPSVGVLAELRARIVSELGAQVPVEVDRAAYEAGIRDELQRYAGHLIDNGNELQAVHVLQEVQRLDTVHAYSGREARGDVASAKGAGYGAPSWRPAEGSPRVSDLGYDE